MTKDTERLPADVGKDIGKDVDKEFDIEFDKEFEQRFDKRFGPETGTKNDAPVDKDFPGQTALLEAHSLLENEKWDRAEESFNRALQLIPVDDHQHRADACAGIAECYVGFKNTEQALFYLELAIHECPDHEASLRRAMGLAEQSQHYGLAFEFRRKLLALPISEQERASQREAMEYDGARQTIDALEGLVGHAPSGFDVLTRLRAAHEAAGDQCRATDIMVAQAQSELSPHDRARSMVRAAEFCAARAGDAHRSMSIFEAALEEDPSVPGAFDAIERFLAERHEYSDLENAYERQADRLDRIEATSELASLLGRLAVLRHDVLRNPQGAIEALSRRVLLEPANADVRAMLAALLDRYENTERACRVLEPSCWSAPTRVPTYHALFRMYSSLKKLDRAFQAASVLVYLGEADLDEQSLYQQFRPVSDLKPKTTLKDVDWDGLYPSDHSDHNACVREILSIVGPAAIAHRIAQLEQSGRLPVLSAGTKHDPVSSPVAAVRCVRWGARILHVPVPETHVLANLTAGLSAIPTRYPTIAVGPRSISRKTVAELAFLVGRCLTYFRPEHRVITYFSSIPELAALVAVAIRIARHGEVGPGMHVDRAMVRAIDNGVRPSDWERVRSAVRRVSASGHTINMQGYVRSLDVAASRVGLLLSGDLPTVGRLMSTDVREVAGLRAADRMRDLIPFSISNAYAAMRSKLGVDVR
ncbi:MAG: hypothetical protein FWD57_04745 [Polyangiaceae bacterium]|nr:hypothetical protein [Polyangiaceae bacterium]